MATPETTTSEPENLRELFNCETPKCPNVYRVMSFMIGDSTAHFHCLACWLGWNTAVIKGLAEQGLIELPAAPGS